MRYRLLLLALCLAAWGWAGHAWPEEGTSGSSAADADTSLTFVIEIGSRLYPDWKEETRAHLNEPFHLGDTEFRATITRFVADFRIVDGEIISVSDQMNNPAAWVFVLGDSAAVDSVWAFLNFPPHFSPTSFFTFQLREVTGYEPGASATREEKE